MIFLNCYSDIAISEEELASLNEQSQDDSETMTEEVVENADQQEEFVEESYYEEYTPDYSYDYSYSGSGALNAYNGVCDYNGYHETYYSQNILPGEGLNIPGRHVAEDGTVRDADDYIVLAMNYDPANGEDHFGEVHETSLGLGKVYDSGCASGVIDVYTNW